MCLMKIRKFYYFSEIECFYEFHSNFQKVTLIIEELSNPHKNIVQKTDVLKSLQNFRFCSHKRMIFYKISIKENFN